ncbi:Protein of unknown function (DUF3078) [Galbibacter orientalis DSM 19592]|uniref:DUF3078 domain-containing protein n=1 Tax=Galbibacter orientalis DSM 19592 TaxID=926559 RepID=I3C4A6_9FLAO|nr:DUF3078 domain-containing protein [Galbibacter orientalis]EIJ38449.1 Protein of unknown function (DUF3078) [Galbibacter orientalis DSM 19592]
MRKLLVIGALIFGMSFTYAQDADAEETPKQGWTKGGTFTFLINQSAFSNWVAGGQNNISGTAGINYDFNYLRGEWSWDNKVIASYGLTNNDDQGTRKTDDRFEYNSLVGKEAFGNWNYSFFLNFRTQFTDGYDYDNDADGDFRTSGLFKPAYLTFVPGLEWKKNENLKFNLAPATSKMTFISDDLYIYDDDIDDFVAHSGPSNINALQAYGIDPGDTFRYELGFYASGYYKFTAMENVTIENTLNMYSNYLEDPQNVDFDYTLNAILKINEYLSTNFTLQLVYDDNAVTALQLREVFGLGVNFGF